MVASTLMLLEHETCSLVHIADTVWWSPWVILASAKSPGFMSLITACTLPISQGKNIPFYVRFLSFIVTVVYPYVFFFLSPWQADDGHHTEDNQCGFWDPWWWVCVCVWLKFRKHPGMMHWDSVLDAVPGCCCCDCQMCCQRARETN